MNQHVPAPLPRPRFSLDRQQGPAHSARRRDDPARSGRRSRYRRRGVAFGHGRGAWRLGRRQVGYGRTPMRLARSRRSSFSARYGPAMRPPGSGACAPPRYASRASQAWCRRRRARSDESQAYRRFWTPLGLGFLAAVAGAIVEGDVVLEPSAGTGLLAILAERDGVTLRSTNSPTFAPISSACCSLISPLRATTRRKSTIVSMAPSGRASC